MQRAQLTGPGEKKIIEDISGYANPDAKKAEVEKSQDLNRTKSSNSEYAVLANDAEEGIASKLKELMEASGQKQAEIDALKVNELKDKVFSTVNFPTLSELKI